MTPMPGKVAEASRGTLRSLKGALIDAASTALLALGLAIPILALRTEQDISNELILLPRWNFVVIAVAAAFAGRLAYLLLAAVRPAPRRRFKSLLPAGLRDQLARSIAGIGLAV